MPFNGSGVYQPPGTDFPAVPSTLIESNKYNAVVNDQSTALSTCVTKDGQTTITANLPMSGYKHTNVAAGAARTDYAAMSNLQDRTGVYVATVGGTADAITLTPSPAIAAYAAGQQFSFIASGANTGAVTVNVSGLGAKAVTKNGATALAAGDIPVSSIILIEYDGTQFQLIRNGAIGSGVNTFTGMQKFAKGADIASANALTLGTDGNYFDVTGTTTITSIGTVGVGTWVKLHFDGALTLTHNATDLILPGGANITTAAGDEAEFVEYATGDWRCVSYVKASGAPIVDTPAVAGDVLQIAISTDAGGTTTSTSLVNVNGSNKAITPRSASSQIIVEVTFQAGIGIVASVNPFGTFRIYDVTNATLVGVAYTIAADSGAGGNGSRAPASVRAIVSNSATSARSFQLQASTSNASATAQAANMVWSLTEIKS